MVEPLFRLAVGAAGPFTVGSLVMVDPADAKHAVAVRRMRVGEAVQLTDGRGLRLRGEVASVDGGSMTMCVGEVCQEPSPALAIALVQALAKGDRDELAIQAATELGAMKIVPWQAERSISRWDASKAAKGEARWQTIVTEAAKQSLRVFDPEVVSAVSSKQLAATIERGELGMVLVLDPTAEQSLVGLLQKLQRSAAVASAFGTSREISLVVGPEGGISDAELEAFEKAGAHRVRLGNEILRTSTAGLAAISAIHALLGTWAESSN